MPKGLIYFLPGVEHLNCSLKEAFLQSFGDADTYTLEIHDQTLSPLQRATVRYPSAQRTETQKDCRWILTAVLP